MADVHERAAFLLKHGYVDLESISRSMLPADPTLLIEHHWPAARELARTVVPGAGQKLHSAELGPPIRRPGAILGIRRELTTGHGPHTALFGKFPARPRPGDVIFTGTPSPLDGPLPRLAPDDLIDTTITGIGTLRNQCIRERTPSTRP